MLGVPIKIRFDLPAEKALRARARVEDRPLAGIVRTAVRQFLEETPGVPAGPWEPDGSSPVKVGRAVVRYLRSPRHTEGAHEVSWPGTGVRVRVFPDGVLSAQRRRRWIVEVLGELDMVVPRRDRSLPPLRPEAYVFGRLVQLGARPDLIEVTDG